MFEPKNTSSSWRFCLKFLKYYSNQIILSSKCDFFLFHFNIDSGQYFIIFRVFICSAPRVTSVSATDSGFIGPTSLDTLIYQCYMIITNDTDQCKDSYHTNATNCLQGATRVVSVGPLLLSPVRHCHRPPHGGGLTRLGWSDDVSFRHFVAETTEERRRGGSSRSNWTSSKFSSHTNRTSSLYQAHDSKFWTKVHGLKKWTKWVYFSVYTFLCTFLWAICQDYNAQYYLCICNIIMCHIQTKKKR